MANVTDRDREELERFLDGTLNLLRQVATEHLHLFPAELRESIQAAWLEFERDTNRSRLLATAREIRSDRAIWAGLYGAQLRLKLDVVRHWRFKWNETLSGKWLKKLLEAIDTILDSLIAATGLDEALKELKDILSNSVEEE